MGNRPAGIGHQIVEQLELFGSLMHLTSLLLNQMPIGVQMNIADNDRCHFQYQRICPFGRRRATAR